MINNDGGGKPPRYELVEADTEHYEVWQADCIADTNSRDQAQRWIDQLSERKQS